MVLVAFTAHAHQFSAGKLTIGHPWTRETPVGADMAVGYMTIANAGAADDVLKGATVDGVGEVMMHQSKVNKGVMSMQPVTGGIPIPAGGKAVLAPGGYHLMFTNLKRPFTEGESISATLVFEKAGRVPVSFKVEKAGAAMPVHEMPGMPMPMNH